MTNELAPARLLPSQREEASHTLTEAFMDDPLYRAVQPNQAKRRRMLIWMNSRVLQYTLLFGEANTIEEFGGIACRLPPGHTELTPLGILRSGLFMIPFYLGPGAYLRLNRYLSVSNRLRQQHGPDKCWYLWVIGVDPKKQGKGLGSRLMRPMLERAELEKETVFLETENNVNVRFYSQHGFKTVASSVVPGMDVTTWSMIRAHGASNNELS